jgi:predicted kinase
MGQRLIIVLMGASGSGKSTWTRNNLTKAHHVYCLDAIRMNNEMDIGSFATVKRLQAIKAVEQGWPLIADATHLIKTHRDVWRNLANRLGLETKLIAFDTQLNTLLEIQKTRTYPVANNVVVNGYKQFQSALKTIQSEGWTNVELIKR